MENVQTVVDGRTYLIMRTKRVIEKNEELLSNYGGELCITKSCITPELVPLISIVLLNNVALERSNTRLYPGDRAQLCAKTWFFNVDALTTGADQFWKRYTESCTQKKGLLQVIHAVMALCDIGPPKLYVSARLNNGP